MSGSLTCREAAGYVARRVWLRTSVRYPHTRRRRAHAASVALCREIGRQGALAEWTARELYPGSDVRTDGELRDYVRRVTASYHHQVGTCRMGSDEDAVVDPELRVHGVEGLRVADASIMPSVTTGNTNAPSMMIGARAAAMMLGAA